MPCSIRGSRYRCGSVLKPQDVVVLLKLAILREHWSYPSLGLALGMSASEVHAAVRRAAHSGLMDESTKRPHRRALVEFLVHGLRYVFPAERGGITFGLPTSYAAPPLRARIRRQADADAVPVWPDAEGYTRGEELRPLYKSVPQAAHRDRKLYELLALVDAIRSGRAHERTVAIEELRNRLRAALAER